MTEIKRSYPETQAHLAILQWLRWKLPNAIIHHSPNEFGMSGKMIARQIAKHKHLGMLVGFPDLLVIFAGRVIGIEVKSEKGRQSEAQKGVQKSFEDNQSEYYVARSIDDVARIFEGQI